jgi:hypothetical protein
MQIARTMGVGIDVGIGSGDLWTPAKALGANGIWLVGDTGLGLVADPALAGDWAGADWAGSGLGPYTHTAGVGHTDPLTRNILTVGLRYETVFTVSGRTAGSVTWMCGATAGTARSTNATFTEDLTCATNTAHSFVPTADFDGVVTVVRVTTLSITSHTPKAATGTLAGSKMVQATAANMPWQVAGGIRGDGTADNIKSDVAALGAWKFLHDGTGMTVAIVATFHSIAATQYMLGTFSASTHSGLIFGTGAGGAVNKTRVIVANGSGSGVFGLDQTGGTVLSAGAKYLFLMRSKNGANFQLRLNGALEIDSAVAAFSAADPLALHLLSITGGTSSWANATLHEFFACNTWSDDAQLARIEAYLRRRHGI